MRQLNETDLQRINTQINAMNARIAANTLHIKKLRASGEATQGQLDVLEAEVDALRAEYDAFVASLAGLFEDPIPWNASFDMRGNDIDLNAGTLKSSAGWTKIQPHWDDLRSPGSSARGAGSKIPSWIKFRDNGAGSTGVYAWYFASSVERELQFQVQLPHAWVEGSEIQPHIHWSTPDANAGTVLWALEYTLASVGDVAPTTTTIYAPGEASGTAYQHLIAGFDPDIDMTGQTLSTMLWCRVYRDAAAVADDYGNAVWLHEIDFHIQIDGLGSNETLSKSSSSPMITAGGTTPVGGGGGGKDPILGE